MKTNREIWIELNEDRYECPACGFRTPNLAHFRRHLASDKHWLMTEFREECPRDLKIVVASFLPFGHVVGLKRPVFLSRLRVPGRGG